MSILIKGMDMPETCEECSFHCYHSDGKYVCVATPLFYPMNLANSKGRRKDFCPLIEIPEPHGRLRCCAGSGGKRIWRGWIDAAYRADRCGRS